MNRMYLSGPALIIPLSIVACETLEVENEEAQSEMEVGVSSSNLNSDIRNALHFKMVLKDGTESGFLYGNPGCHLELHAKDKVQESSHFGEDVVTIIDTDDYDPSTKSFHKSSQTNEGVEDTVIIRYWSRPNANSDPVISYDHPFVTHPDAWENMELYVDPACGTLGEIEFIKLVLRYKRPSGDFKTQLLLERDFEDLDIEPSGTFGGGDLIPMGRWRVKMQEEKFQYEYCKYPKSTGGECETLDFEELPLPKAVYAQIHDLFQVGNLKYIGLNEEPNDDASCTEHYWYYEVNFDKQFDCAYSYPDNECHSSNGPYVFYGYDKSFYKADRMYRVVFTDVVSDTNCWWPGNANWAPDLSTAIPADNSGGVLPARKCILGVFKCEQPQVGDVDDIISDPSYCEDWDGAQPYEPKEGDYVRRRDFGGLRGDDTNGSHTMTFLELMMKAKWNDSTYEWEVKPGSKYGTENRHFTVLDSEARTEGFKYRVNTVDQQGDNYRWEWMIGEVDNEWGGGIDDTVPEIQIETSTLLNIAANLL